MMPLEHRNEDEFFHQVLHVAAMIAARRKHYVGGMLVINSSDVAFAMIYCEVGPMGTRLN